MTDRQAPGPQCVGACPSLRRGSPVEHAAVQRLPQAAAVAVLQHLAGVRDRCTVIVTQCGASTGRPRRYACCPCHAWGAAGRAHDTLATGLCECIYTRNASQRSQHVSRRRRTQHTPSTAAMRPPVAAHARSRWWCFRPRFRPRHLQYQPSAANRSNVIHHEWRNQPHIRILYTVG